MQYAAEEKILLIEHDRSYVTEVNLRNQYVISSLMENRTTKDVINIIKSAHNMVSCISSTMKLNRKPDKELADLLDHSSLVIKNLLLRSSHLLDPTAKTNEVNTLNEMTERLDKLVKLATVQQFELGVRLSRTHKKNKARIHDINSTYH